MRFLRNGKARTRPRGALLLVFLVLTLVLAVGLAYQAVDAARSHRETAESVLGDYARLAAWEFSRRVEAGLGGVTWPAFEPLRGAPPVGRGDPLPAVETIAAEVEEICSCQGVDPPSFYFRLDLSSGELSISPDTATSSGGLAGLLAERVERDGDLATGHPVLLSDSERTGVDVLVYALLRDRSGAVRAVYGFAMTHASLRSAFEQLCDDPLIPAAIAGDQPNDSLLHLTVATLDGGTLYESPVRYPQRFVAEDTLDERVGGVIARAAIRPEAANQLVIGGLPGSRLPLIVGLLLLAGGVGAASLVQLRRERELARLRDDFVSGVSHELRTPLAQIRMFAELLDDDKLRSGAERRRSTRILRQESERLTHLIENVLGYSRSRHTPIQLVPEEIELESFIEETVESFRPLAEARDVRFMIESTSGEVGVADRAALRQILINLLDNAVKYGPIGGTVTVEAERANGITRIRVSDEGPGVSAADRERIWEPYLRLERDANGPVGGSGIGLAVVRELAMRHGGGARVEAASGGGGCFVIELPVEPTPAAESARSGNGKSVE